MTQIEETENNWNEARAKAEKALHEYWDAYERWQILEKEEELAFELHLQALQEYRYTPYRPLRDGETISDTDQWRFSEQHEWEYFKASVGQIWVGSEWTEGTQTRTLQNTIT